MPKRRPEKGSRRLKVALELHKQEQEPQRGKMMELVSREGR